MSHSFNVFSYFSCVSMGIYSKGNRAWSAAHSPADEPVPRHSQLTYNGPTVHVISSMRHLLELIIYGFRYFQQLMILLFDLRHTSSSAFRGQVLPT